MAETPEELAEEVSDWRPRDLTDGPSALLARAAGQVRTGGFVAALWGLALLGCVGLRFLGLSSLTSVAWDIGAGVGLMVCALGASARSRAAMAVLSLLAAADVPVQALALRGSIGHAVSAASALAMVRLSLLSAVLYLIVRGYRGAVDYHLLRGGAPPRNWRYWGPMPFITGFIVYFGAVLFTSLFWKAALEHTFSTPGARVHAGRKGSIPLMKSLYADLTSIDAKPFQEGDDDERDKRNGTARSGKGDLSGKLPGVGGGTSGSATAVAELGDLSSLPEPVRAVVEEAMTFSAQADNVACFSEALHRHDACKDDQCHVLAKVFMTACLPGSRPTKDFCTGVPSPVSIIETTAWRARVCDQSARPPAACYIFFLSLQNFCHPEALE